ncbi:type III secretion system chaperone [Bordetella genomosp. 13]|uniref:type III secretion system chaperone n=1 Tax=Bordetella genomosp. 13 TaxID=463040 RepID=UPI001643634C|nr:type III secretion system chaperone [Bordetella genomosp. 13]
MSTASTHFATLIDALNQRCGMALHSTDGASAFLDTQGAYWQLSLGQGSDLLAITCSLGALSGWPDGAALRLLELNTRFDVLRGASLGVDALTQDVRLMLLLPMAGLDATLLENALLNVMAVRDRVIEQREPADGASGEGASPGTAPRVHEYAERPPGLADFA